MNTKKILSFIALLGGEAIIIAAFMLLGVSLADDILLLNIVVSSIIYGLFFLDILVPWIDLKDKSGKIGSLGVRWLFTWLYAIAAIAVMLVGNLVYEWSFVLQTIIHCGLVFVLILGFVASLHSGNKVQKIYEQENLNRNGINEMKTAMRNLKNEMNVLSDLPTSFATRINALEEGIRFISPANNQEAYNLEHSFTSTINDIAFAISNYSMNKEAIESNLKKVEVIYQDRKTVYSH